MNWEGFVELNEMMNSNDWRAELCARDVDVREDGPYVLLKYSIKADFSDPLVCQCRGVIFKNEGGAYRCICHPFEKFFNFQETYAAPIDWSKAVVTEKVDGSLCKVWFDGEWKWSTNNTIDAYKAPINDFMSFGELIEQADNYSDIQWDRMDEDKTYLFELVSPYNQVVVKYEAPHLYHIATIGVDGGEFDCEIGIEKPKTYPLSSLNDCVRAAEKMNDGMVDQEGFVVFDGQNRIKIKSPKYIMYHRMWNNGGMSAERIVEILKTEQLEKTIAVFPLMADTLLSWNAAIAQFLVKAQKVIANSRSYYAEFDYDRRAAAQVIKEMEFPSIGFWALDHEGTVFDFVSQLSTSKFIKFVEQVKGD